MRNSSFQCVGNQRVCEAHYQCSGRWGSLHWGNAVSEGVRLMKYCTSAEPHNITLYVEREVTVAPKGIVAGLLTSSLGSSQYFYYPVSILAPQSVWFAHFYHQLGLYIRECTKPKRTCPSSSAGLLIGVFISREPVEVCVCITVWSWRLEVHIMTKVVKGRVIGNCACALFSSNAAMGFD